MLVLLTSFLLAGPPTQLPDPAVEASRRQQEKIAFGNLSEWNVPANGRVTAAQVARLVDTCELMRKWAQEGKKPSPKPPFRDMGNTPSSHVRAAQESGFDINEFLWVSSLYAAYAHMVEPSLIEKVSAETGTNLEKELDPESRQRIMEARAPFSPEHVLAHRNADVLGTKHERLGACRAELRERRYHDLF